MAVDFATTQYTAALAANISETDKFFISVWVYAQTSKDVLAHAFGLSIGTADDNNLGQVGLNTGGAGRIQGYGVFAGSNDNIVGTEDIALDTWFHVSMAFLSTTSREMWENGVSVGTDTTSRSSIDCTTVVLGSRPGGDRNWDGFLAEPAVWSGSGLSSAVGLQMSAALAAGASPLTVNPSLLVHYWPLYNTSTLTDMVGGLALSEVTSTAANAASHPPVYGRAMPYIITAPAAAVGGTTPKGPLGHPLHGPFGGPI